MCMKDRVHLSRDISCIVFSFQNNTKIQHRHITLLLCTRGVTYSAQHYSEVTCYTICASHTTVPGCNLLSFFSKLRTGALPANLNNPTPYFFFVV